jgi:hypothetical protein
MVGPHFSAGRAMLAPVHYDDQVPSSPSLLKVRHQSVRLSDQPVLFWSGWGKSSSRKSEGSLSGFCTSLAKPTAQAIRSAGWLRRYWVSTTLV